MGRGLTRRLNLRAALVVAQLAISIVVLVCAGLFLRSLSKAVKTDPGFSVENLVTMRIDPGGLGYDTDSGKRFYSELLHRIEEQPGVRSASLTTYMLLGDSNSGIQIIKEGDPEPLPNQGIILDRSVIAPHYLDTMGIKLLQGRDFTERDDAKAPQVAIVNQEFARKFYGGEQNALGKRIHFWATDSPLVEIVGITKDGFYRSLYEDRRPYIFIPEYQMYESGMTLLVKANSASDVGRVADASRREIARLDPRLPIVGMLLGEQNLTYAYWGPRLSAGIGGAFGILALLLTTMGLYSVMTYSRVATDARDWNSHGPGRAATRCDEDGFEAGNWVGDRRHCNWSARSFSRHQGVVGFLAECGRELIRSRSWPFRRCLCWWRCSLVTSRREERRKSIRWWR